MTPEQARRVADATAALAARFTQLGIDASTAAAAADRFITDLRKHGWRPAPGLDDLPPQPPRQPASEAVRQAALEDMRRAARAARHHDTEEATT